MQEGTINQNEVILRQEITNIEIDRDVFRRIWILNWCSAFLWVGLLSVFFWVWLLTSYCTRLLGGTLYCIRLALTLDKFLSLFLFHGLADDIPVPRT